MPVSIVDALHAISRSITEVQEMLEAGAVPQPAQFARVTDLVGEVLGHLVRENGKREARLDIGRSLAAILAAIAEAYRALAARSRDALVDAVEEMRAAVADALAAYPWLGAAP